LEARRWLQRIAFTSIATIATAAGFALILLAGMLISGDEITVKTAFVWSLAAFVAAGLAPALGLAPELPGSAAGRCWSDSSVGRNGDFYRCRLWLFLRSKA